MKNSTKPASKPPKPTTVAGEPTITPALTMPISARNRPMPAATPTRTPVGTARTICSRTFQPGSDSTMNISPATNTAARAACQERPCPSTSV
jgi:hypothetical protein